jgi:hypothetical protein
LALLACFMILLDNFTLTLALLARFEGRQGCQLRHLRFGMARFAREAEGAASGTFFQAVSLYISVPRKFW